MFSEIIGKIIIGEKYKVAENTHRLLSGVN